MSGDVPLKERLIEVLYPKIRDGLSIHSRNEPEKIHDTAAFWAELLIREIRDYVSQMAAAQLDLDTIGNVVLMDLWEEMGTPCRPTVVPAPTAA